MVEVSLEQDPTLKRDIHSKGIVATDLATYRLYKQRRNVHQQLQRQQAEISSMKDDIAEIKQLLKHFTSR